jgi:hypothetical protein
MWKQHIENKPLHWGILEKICPLPYPYPHHHAQRLFVMRHKSNNLFCLQPLLTHLLVAHNTIRVK